QTFVNELKIWGELRHPNILLLLGAGLNTGVPFMVCPLMTGGSVNQYLAKVCKGSKDEFFPTALPLLIDTCKGMSYLHNRKIVHGDLKGANILVDRYGNAVVTDFGGASLKKVRKTSISKTKHRGAMTYAWTAPERLERGTSIETDLAFAADVYSFAVTCCEIFSGGVPPLFLSDTQIIIRVVRDSHRPARPGDFPNSLWGIVELCWKQDPRERPTFDKVIQLLVEISHAGAYVDFTLVVSTLKGMCIGGNP
ncbi:kinase-like domain-containing protein, partial [Blyttiomyces helicus]